MPSTVGTPQTVGTAYALRGQGELGFKSWKSPLSRAPLTTKTVDSTLCYIYGRMLLLLLTSAFCPPRRPRLWEQYHRELSLLKLSRHLPAGAEYWLHALFKSEAALQLFLPQISPSAERLVTKASRKRRTTAQLLRESLRSHTDFFDPALALAA